MYLKKTFRFVALFSVGCGFTQPMLAQQTFLHPFAPTEAFVKPVEQPFRSSVCLNGEWKFLPIEKAEKLGIDKIKNPVLPDNTGWETTPVKVPSPWNVNSFARGDGSGGDFLTYPSYPKKWETIRAGWLSRTITYRKEWKDKRLILHFDAVGGYTQIFINKHKVGENLEVFLPFEVDVTDELKPGQDNELLMWVADAQLLNQPGKYGRRIYVGGSFWGQHAIGIWQDVNLVAKPLVNIQNTYIKPSVSANELTVEAVISNTSTKPQQITVGGDVSPWINQAGKDMISAPEPKWQLGGTALSLPQNTVKLNANSQTTVTFKVKVDGKLKLWDTEHPNLYGLVLTAKNGSNDIDKQFTRFGWREFTINGKKLSLNNKPIVLKGDSWHFMGIPQMTRRYAWAWFKLLQDTHANAVRLHAQPYPQFYLDMADEMGICVLDETGMWASDGGPKVDAEAYWKSSEEHMKRFVLRDRNHPAVFGWSVCNENLPVVIGVYHAPDSLVKRQVAEINKWIAITHELDPSRVWISADGETQAEFNSPVIIGHYGGSDENYRNLSSKGKPWGIGEAGMAYYATPHQTAVYNGNRSYESQQGRMEAVAYEATKLINMLKKYNASYMSIFNLVWYGAKPLELGLKDTTRAPLPTDGIFFGPYKQDQPGVQPERLGPYTTTLNPGYDATLPLYKKWPLLDAAKISFGDTAIVNQPAVTAAESTPGNTYTGPANNVVLLSTDRDSALYKTLADMGVPVNTSLNKNGHNLLIIDGAHAPADAKSLAMQKTVSQQGDNVLVWSVDPATVKTVNQYLPKPIEVTNRKATSFLTKKADPLTAGLGNVDFYFSEIADKPLMTYGLSGDMVKQGTVLLDASNTDWKTWNKRSEFLKTASILRSEREYKPEGKALISMASGKGKTYVFAIDPVLLSNTSVSLMRRMLVNLGVTFTNKIKDITAVSANGKLTNALLLASFDISGKSDAEISKLDLLKSNKPEDFFPGKQVGSHFWERANVPDGVFDFSKLHFDGPQNNAVAYLSFWMYSPRSLSNLLLEPDMPRLDMYLGADDGYQVFLNNNLIKEAINGGGFTSRGQSIKALPLEKGWNHFVIKAIQKAGAWKLAVEFDCDKKAFLNEIKTQTTH